MFVVVSGGDEFMSIAVFAVADEFEATTKCTGFKRLYGHFEHLTFDDFAKGNKTDDPLFIYLFSFYVYIFLMSSINKGLEFQRLSSVTHYKWL